MYTIHAELKPVKLFLPCPIQILSFSLSPTDESHLVSQCLQPSWNRSFFSDLKGTERVQLHLRLLKGVCRVHDLLPQRFASSMIATQYPSQFLFYLIAFLCTRDDAFLQIL